MIDLKNLLHKKSTYAYFVLLALFALVPFVVRGYLLYTSIYIGIYIVLALSLNLLVGYMGYASIAHSVFIGIGGYSLALLSLRWGASPWIGLVLAAAVAGAIGFLVGIPFLKVRSMYFAIGTLALGLIAYGLFVNLYQYTGGTAGLSNIPRLFAYDSQFYYFVMAIAVGIMLFTKWLVNTSFGKALVAIREDEDLAGQVGLNVVRYKRITFALTTALSGFIGATYISFLGYVTADYFTPVASFNMLVGILVGGAGTIFGPVIGTLVILGLPEMLRPLFYWRPTFLGLVLIFVVLLFPQGIWGGINKLVNRFRKTTGDK